MIRELKELREYFGWDGRAINKHAVRYYEHGGRFFALDKTLDGIPPFFTLSALTHDPTRDIDEQLFERAAIYVIPKTIRVGGAEYWGDGAGWKEAERMAFEAIAETV